MSCNCLRKISENNHLDVETCHWWGGFDTVKIRAFRKQKKKKETVIMPVFCPFCGVAYDYSVRDDFDDFECGGMSV